MGICTKCGYLTKDGDSNTLAGAEDHKCSEDFIKVTKVGWKIATDAAIAAGTIDADSVKPKIEEPVV